MPEVSGSAIKGFISLIIFGVVALVVLAFIFGTVVYPGYMGVRQITFGPSRGFSEKVLDPGYHWSFPVYSKVHRIPRKITILNLNRGGESLNSQVVGPSVEIQTTDGSSVKADLSILCRFFPEKGKNDLGEYGGSVDLIQQLGYTQPDWELTIVKVSVDEVKRALGKMSTSEFYNPSKREELLNQATGKINTRLAPYGIYVEGVLVRRYTYTEERINNAIFQKNLQDQEERLNAAASRLAKAKADLESVAAEMDAKIQTLTVQGTSQSQVIISEGDLYETELKARGDLLVAEAEAEIRRQKAELLSSTVGADTYIARELVPLLSTLKGGVISNVDPYDLNGWLKRLGVNPEVAN